MTAFSLVTGTRTSLPFTSTGLSALASATYVAATSTLDLRAIYNSVTQPLDVTLELAVTPGTVSGNKQALLFIQASEDNTNFSTGPVSGTTVTDQLDLYLVGVLPLNTNTTLQRKIFSIVSTLGWLPGAINVVVFNDSGASFSTGVVFYTIRTGDGR